MPGPSLVRGLHEQTNPAHRIRVEHDAHTLLIHLSDEDADGWTTIAIDRESRRWAVAQSRRQADTAREAYERLYQPQRAASLRRHRTTAGSRRNA
jgi:hypothetical protein